MSLNITSINEAYSKFRNNTNLRGDRTLIQSDVIYNKREQNYVLDGNRYTNSKYPAKYIFAPDQLYDYQGVSHGSGPGKNINVDDHLTRGNLVPRPGDKLAEKDLFSPYRIMLPTQVQPIHHDKFLVSTSLQTNPQQGYNPIFERQGINTRHYNRKPDSFYKEKYARY